MDILLNTFTNIAIYVLTITTASIIKFIINKSVSQDAFKTNYRYVVNSMTDGIYYIAANLHAEEIKRHINKQRDVLMVDMSQEDENMDGIQENSKLVKNMNIRTHVVIVVSLLITTIAPHIISSIYISSITKTVVIQPLLTSYKSMGTITRSGISGSSNNEVKFGVTCVSNTSVSNRFRYMLAITDAGVSLYSTVEVSAPYANNYIVNAKVNPTDICLNNKCIYYADGTKRATFETYSYMTDKMSRNCGKVYDYIIQNITVFLGQSAICTSQFPGAWPSFPISNDQDGYGFVPSSMSAEMLKSLQDCTDSFGYTYYNMNNVGTITAYAIIGITMITWLFLNNEIMSGTIFRLLRVNKLQLILDISTSLSNDLMMNIASNTSRCKDLPQVWSPKMHMTINDSTSRYKHLMPSEQGILVDYQDIARDWKLLFGDGLQRDYQ